MSKWLRVQTDFVDHPKTRMLAARLGDERAGWYVLRLWSWLSRFCPTGHVADTLRTSAEVACEWRGLSGELLAALVAVGFIDDTPDGGFQAHDWSDQQGWVAARAEKDRKRKAEARARTSAGRVADTLRTSLVRDVTLRDVTLREKKPMSSKLDPDLVWAAGVAAELNAPGRPLDAQPCDDVGGDGAQAATTPPRASTARLEALLTDDEFQVFEHWRVRCRHPGAKATPERKRLIAKQLKLYSVEELMQAIDGCAASEWHQGVNERHRRYDSLELILRDAKRIEEFRDRVAP